MSFLGRIFKKKPKKISTINEFIIDIESKLNSLTLGDKSISKLEKKTNDINVTLKKLNDRIQEFSQERKEMDEISKRVIELVSLIYTMDTKINNLSKKFEEIKREMSITKPVKIPKLKRGKDEKQFDLDLRIHNNRDKK